MITKVLLLSAMAAAAAAYGAAGDIINSFAVGNARGLAYDYGDGNIWYTAVAANNVTLNKFNSTTGSVMGSPMTLAGMYWNTEIGYGYLVGGNRTIVALDQSTPVIKLYTTAGSYLGSLSNPYTGGSTQGCDCDWNGTFLYIDNISFNSIYRWTGSSWQTFATASQGFPGGIAVAYGNVWVYAGAPAYCIYRFSEAGSLIGSMVFGSTFVVAGMSRGRVDCYNGSEDSIFMVVLSTNIMIYEVSVGNVESGAGATTRSLGKIKSLYQ